MKLRNIFLSVLIFIICLFFLIPIGKCIDGCADSRSILISKVLSSKKVSLMTGTMCKNVYHNINDKNINYDLYGVKFLSATELIKAKNNNFFSVKVEESSGLAKVSLIHYKTSLLFNFTFKKNGEKWEEVSSEWSRGKLEPSKPYYINLEIKRLTDSDYRNYPIELIPRDSLH